MQRPCGCKPRFGRGSARSGVQRGGRSSGREYETLTSARAKCRHVDHNGRALLLYQQRRSVRDEAPGLWRVLP